MKALAPLLAAYPLLEAWFGLNKRTKSSSVPEFIVRVAILAVRVTYRKLKQTPKPKEPQ